MSTPITPPEATLQLVASLEDLESIRRFIEQRAKILGVDPSTVYDVDLAVTELATNSLVHGYAERRGWIEVAMLNEDGELVVRLHDRAIPFDPTQVPPPDLTTPLDKRRFGGMGLHLTRKVVSRMEYRSPPEGGNEITLVFPTSPQSQADE
jgi:serine/threonine-protein kinase RsbW